MKVTCSDTEWIWTCYKIFKMCIFQQFRWKYRRHCTDHHSNCEKTHNNSMNWLWFVLTAAALGITSAYNQTNAGLLYIPHILGPNVKKLILDRNRITAITNELEDYSYLQVSRSLITIMKGHRESHISVTCHCLSMCSDHLGYGFGQ